MQMSLSMFYRYISRAFLLSTFHKNVVCVSIESTFNQFVNFYLVWSIFVKIAGHSDSIKISFDYKFVLF